jgi:hypothetical protein
MCKCDEMRGPRPTWDQCPKGGEGSDRVGVEKKEEEKLKEKINMKISTKYQICLSTKG